jgi:periplasmic copper chaperone A
MKKIITIILCLFSVQLLADSNQLQFTNGWIKQLPPVVPMRAGYVDIANPSNEDVEITAIQSDAFEKVEMHETIMQDGMMKMVEQKSFKIPAHGSIQLKPGGKHIMLITPLSTLQIGDKVPLLLTFSDDKAQKIELEVKQ